MFKGDLESTQKNLIRVCLKIFIIGVRKERLWFNLMPVRLLFMKFI